MTEEVLCDKCYCIIDVTTLVEEYFETPQEETIWIVKCSNCGEINSISWTPDVIFSAYRATEEDKKNYDLQE